MLISYIFKILSEEIYNYTITMINESDWKETILSGIRDKRVTRC